MGLIGGVAFAAASAPAAGQWRVDISGGAFVAPGRVQFNEQHLGPLCCPFASVSARFDTGGSYALGIGYDLTNHVELVGRFQHSLSRDAHGLRLGRGGLFAESVIPTEGAALDVFSVTGGVRIHLVPPGRRLRPWLVGEMGWYRATAELKQPFCGRSTCGPPFLRFDGSDDAFGIQAGGGFDFAVTDPVSVGVDVRYHKAFDLIGGLHFVTTMATVGIHF